MVSARTMGLMASKNARWSRPTKRAMSAESDADVNGPVAMIHTSPRRRRRESPAISPRSMVMRGCACDRGGHAFGELVAIDGQRRARGHAHAIGHAHHERAEPPHLFLQQADGVVELVAAKGIAADQLGEPVGLVDGGRRDGPHLVQHDRHAQDAACHAASLPARPPPMMWTIG